MGSNEEVVEVVVVVRLDHSLPSELFIYRRNKLSAQDLRESELNKNLDSLSQDCATPNLELSLFTNLFVSLVSQVTQRRLIDLSMEMTEICSTVADTHSVCSVQDSIR